MNTINKTKQNISLYLIMSLLTLTSPSLLAEKHDHDGEHEQHSETNEHKESEHEKHSDHNEDGHEKDHSDHKEDTHDERKHEEDDGHGHGDNKPEKKKDDGHGHGDNEHEEETSTDVELSKAQIRRAGIETMRLQKQSVSKKITALSEVKLNQYRTIKVSPSITTRVEKRHVKRGDKVKKGDLLAVLHTISTTDISANVLATADLAASSAELAASIAEAKGELAAANATWQRIQSLGKDAISGKRYTEARIAKEQAKAKLNAYGKSQSQVNKLLKSGSKAVQKHFELRAEQAGTVIKDDFVLGQMVTPEDVLFEISDLDHLWVEANIKPNEVSNINIGSIATIPVAGKTLQGKVVFIGRLLDEKTRTLPVRIELDAKDISLYPGQFVKTSIGSKSTRTAITIPAEAILRGADGDWMVFIEEAPGRFVPQEVEIIENLRDKQGEKMVVEGIETGTTIVSKGAFFVQSELAKSGFEVHNH